MRTLHHHCVMWRCVRKEERKGWDGVGYPGPLLGCDGLQ